MADLSSIRDTIIGVWDKIRNVVRNAGDTSLSQYTKDTNVFARAYIDYTVTGDDICLPLLGMLNQMYVAFVITALNLDTFCESGRTVSDVVRKVASEDYKDVINLVGVSKSNEVAGTNEAIAEFVRGHVIPRTKEKEVLENIKLIDAPSMEAGPIDLERESQRLTTGRLIELDILTRQVTEDNKLGNYGSKQTGINTFKLYIYVQIFPTIIPPEVCKGFLTANFIPTLAHRWKQVKAGEIRFWKDFVFASDLIKRQKEALKADKTGILASMLSNNQGKFVSHIWQLIMKGDPSRNLANSFLIMTKDNFRSACMESNVDFNDFVQRQKFFMLTYCLMVVVVDSMSGTVDIYTNGFKLVGNYNYAMVNKVGTKSKDSFDLKEVMQAMNAGNMPRF